MKTIFTVLLLLFLILVLIQDLKSRTIHILFPILIFCVSIYISKYLNKIQLNNLITNVGFFISTIIILSLYMSIKNKQFLNPFQNYFGFGDFLFYLSITPLFFIKNYILFFILSMIFAIAIQKVFKKNINQNNVPLAGLSALFLVFVIAIDLFLGFNKITLI